MDPQIQYALITLASIIAGYILFFVILKILPAKLRSQNKQQKQEVLKEAKKQCQSIMNNSIKSADETIAIMQDELEEDIEERIESLKIEEDNMISREEFAASEQSRVDKMGAALKKKSDAADLIEVARQAKLEEKKDSKRLLIESLETKAEVPAINIIENTKAKLVEAKQLDCQKALKSLSEELDLSAKKNAERTLDRTLSRYSPNFTWPKAINTIEIENKKTLEALQDPDCTLLEQLKELSDAEIRVVTPEEEDRHSSIIRLASGYGPHREAAKQTLIDLLPQGKNAWNKAGDVFAKHQAKFDAESVLLGKKAVNELCLRNIHPEVQKLIGSLNWRTSYRQNQWHHTVEVAKLAGIIGSELGIDPEASKRVGLLHDIGKAIDYRIEGSHAVISGDYADRFGESKLICDTVMSHHADLLVETPLAYILRVADTLSGARPGARVNLEEGYQIRLSAIADSVRSFQGISDLAIMNGGREVHIQVNHKKVKENQVKELAESIARKIEEDVAFPGQIKVMVTRQFESVTVA